MPRFADIWPFSDIPTDTISIYEGPEQFLADFELATEELRTIFAAYWFQAEVLNGGLIQFFENDTGVLAPEAALACRSLELPQLAAFVDRAIACFGENYPRDRDLRHAALDRLDRSALEGLDNAVTDLMYDENGGLEKAALRYLEKHDT